MWPLAMFRPGFLNRIATAVRDILKGMRLRRAVPPIKVDSLVIPTAANALTHKPDGQLSLRLVHCCHKYPVAAHRHLVYRASRPSLQQYPRLMEDEVSHRHPEESQGGARGHAPEGRREGFLHVWRSAHSGSGGK